MLIIFIENFEQSEEGKLLIQNNNFHSLILFYLFSDLKGANLFLKKANSLFAFCRDGVNRRMPVFYQFKMYNTGKNGWTCTSQIDKYWFILPCFKN